MGGKGTQQNMKCQILLQAALQSFTVHTFPNLIINLIIHSWSDFLPLAPSLIVNNGRVH